MERMLDVYLQERRVGHLIQDDGGQMSFEYVESWLAQPGATALSQSLPLRKERFPAKECRGFFGGILPEESKREIIARNLGISARNDYAMLEQIGGECAGAVTFLPAGQELPKRDYHYRKLDAKELAGILRELPKRPLLAGEKGIRLSLAGAQDKVAVRIEGEEVSLPLGGAPSTHILKPAVERFVGVVFNEALCMTLAAHMNLPAAKVETRKVEDVEYLQVERYDRKHVTIDGAPGIERLHQEDFCQAQNIVSELKYQKEGGRHSSNASLCCATCRPHRSLILRIFWTPRFSTISLATTTRTARIFHSYTQARKSGWRPSTMRSARFTIRN